MKKWDRQSYKLCCANHFDCQYNHLLSAVGNRASLVIPPCQRSRYATYFDVAVLRCLLQPHWSEEGTQWSLMYYLQRLRHMLEEKPEKPPEPDIPLLPRPRSSSMVAAAPSLVNTHKTQVRGTRSVGIWITTSAVTESLFLLCIQLSFIPVLTGWLVGYSDAVILSLPSCTARPFRCSLACNLPFQEVLSNCLLCTLI